MRVDAFDYHLPEELIASEPLPERDASRLLVLGPDGLDDRRVVDLPSLAPARCLVIVNDTRVIPARLLGHRKPTGGKVEIFLCERVSAPGGAEEIWRALGRASKELRPGTELDFGPLAAIVRGRTEDGMLEVALSACEHPSVAAAIEAVGHVPLPPYIKRADRPADRERYQTVFAASDGAVAAPTAGLHLTERIFDELRAAGAEIAKVTLHVGLGTFQPVTAEDLDDHAMHSERYVVPVETARAIDRARERGAAVLAVGTTSVRALESARDPERPGRVRPSSGDTRLLIQPGYTFGVVDALFTNFHLPRSTLLALACAFGGTEHVLSAYAHAARAGYRFTSYGDAMLMLPRPLAAAPPRGEERP